jgi:hypothetical protein
MDHYYGAMASDISGVESKVDSDLVLSASVEELRSLRREYWLRYLDTWGSETIRGVEVPYRIEEIRTLYKGIFLIRLKGEIVIDRDVTSALGDGRTLVVSMKNGKMWIEADLSGETEEMRQFLESNERLYSVTPLDPVQMELTATGKAKVLSFLNNNLDGMSVNASLLSEFLEKWSNQFQGVYLLDFFTVEKPFTYLVKVMTLGVLDGAPVLVGHTMTLQEEDGRIICLSDDISSFLPYGSVELEQPTPEP